jgi:hypothetical protein
MSQYYCPNWFGDSPQEGVSSLPAPDSCPSSRTEIRFHLWSCVDKPEVASLFLHRAAARVTALFVLGGTVVQLTSIPSRK